MTKWPVHKQTHKTTRNTKNNKTQQTSTGFIFVWIILFYIHFILLKLFHQKMLIYRFGQ